MPFISLTQGVDSAILINTDHIIAVRSRTDEEQHDYCEIEVLNSDPIVVSETVAEVSMILQAALKP